MEKPLGHKGYGSIPHLPESRLGPGDHALSVSQAAICVRKLRDRYDEVIVQEKLDGVNAAVAKVRGEIVPLNRRGYRAITSPHAAYRLFHHWAMAHADRFDALLTEGERVVGEWIAVAVGTRYRLLHEPFVPFDLMRGVEIRALYDTFVARVTAQGFVVPRLIHRGGPLPVDELVRRLEPSGHGALDPVEGAVYRVQRRGKVDFLAKWVRPDKVDGRYLFVERELRWNEGLETYVPSSWIASVVPLVTAS